MGIQDPYAPDAIKRFLELAASGENPAMEVHALRLAEGGRILAVFGGAVNATRYSGMMTSFDADPEVGRFSPGDLLLHHLVREQTARGRLSFDLGVGASALQGEHLRRDHRTGRNDLAREPARPRLRPGKQGPETHEAAGEGRSSPLRRRFARPSSAAPEGLTPGSGRPAAELVDVARHLDLDRRLGRPVRAMST